MLSKSAAITLMAIIDAEEFKAFSNVVDCTRSSAETLFVAVTHAISAIAGNISQQGFENKMRSCEGGFYMNTGRSIKSLSNDPQKVVSNFLQEFSQEDIRELVSVQVHRANLYSNNIIQTSTMLIMMNFLTNLRQLNEIDPAKYIGNSALSFFRILENGSGSNASSFNLLPKELRTNISFFATKACAQDEFPNANMDQRILAFHSI